MDEQEGREPTAAIPAQQYFPPPSQPERIAPQVPIAAQQLPREPVRAAYVFGHPVTYALRRFLAVTLDLIVVASVATMFLYGLIAINPFTGLPNNSEGGFDATLVTGIAIAVLYVWLFEALFGTTLGKLAFALHVYAPKGRIVGLGRSFTRNVLRPVDLIVIGPILAMLPGHRRLGDLLGGTVVAHSPLRAFSPLVGWAAILGLCALPFFLAGGTITILAVGTAFVEFVPRLLANATHAVLLALLAINGMHALVTPGAGAPAAVSAPTLAPTAAPTAVPPTPASLITG